MLDKNQIKKCCGTCEHQDIARTEFPCSKCSINDQYISHYKLHKAIANLVESGVNVVDTNIR